MASRFFSVYGYMVTINRKNAFTLSEKTYSGYQAVEKIIRFSGKKMV